MKFKKTSPGFSNENSENLVNPTLYFSFFKPGVQGATPGRNSSFRGRILPCFDLSYDTQDTEFYSSVDAYRLSSSAFSQFSVRALTYSFLGNKKGRLISPASKPDLQYNDLSPESVADPVYDIIACINKLKIPRYSALLHKNESGYAKVTPRSWRYFFNMFGYRAGDKSTTGNYVVDVPKKSYDGLCNALDLVSADGKGRDKNWPQYLYGDITDPATGIVVDIIPIWDANDRYANSGTESGYYNGFNLHPYIPVNQVRNPQSLEGTRELSVSIDILKRRSLLLGEESVFNIWSYSDIVDYLQDDGAFPVELLKQACGHMVDIIGKDDSHTTYFNAPGSKNEEPAYVSTPAPPAPLPDTGAEYIPVVKTEVTPTKETPPPQIVINIDAEISEDVSEEDISWYYNNATPEAIERLTSEENLRFIKIGVYLENQQ